MENGIPGRNFRAGLSREIWHWQSREKFLAQRFAGILRAATLREELFRDSAQLHAMRQGRV